MCEHLHVKQTNKTKHTHTPIHSLPLIQFGVVGGGLEPILVAKGMLSYGQAAE